MFANTRIQRMYYVRTDTTFCINRACYSCPDKSNSLWYPTKLGAWLEYYRTCSDRFTFAWFPRKDFVRTAKAQCGSTLSTHDSCCDLGPAIRNVHFCRTTQSVLQKKSRPRHRKPVFSRIAFAEEKISASRKRPVYECKRLLWPKILFLVKSNWVCETTWESFVCFKIYP